MNNTSAAKRLAVLLTRLAGRRNPVAKLEEEKASQLFTDGSSIGYSQFNELMLSHGHSRISRGFFEYLVGGIEGFFGFYYGESGEFARSATFQSLDEIETGVQRFECDAILRFGNVRFGFKRFSEWGEDDRLASYMIELAGDDAERFVNRHEPLHRLEVIPPSDARYLGYLLRDEIDTAYQAYPEDEQAEEEYQRKERVTQLGISNYRALLASDHMDVYIATSMREPHDYVQVSLWASKLRSDPQLADLNLRWFDPTQSYCENRIDKGLVEALMLKRAYCTVYFSQEADTFGKDSELASTLAQGKPVIAYVPKPDRSYVEELLEQMHRVYPTRAKTRLVLDLLQQVAPGAAWEEQQVRHWLNGDPSACQDEMIDFLVTKMQHCYDRRAATLQRNHPLGIQVNLTQGVANGVLVVRTLKECATLVRRVMLRELEFVLERETHEAGEYLLLHETISDSVYRVATGDSLLANTFWNFYLDRRVM